MNPCSAPSSVPQFLEPPIVRVLTTLLPGTGLPDTLGCLDAEAFRRGKQLANLAMFNTHNASDREPSMSTCLAFLSGTCLDVSAQCTSAHWSVRFGILDDDLSGLCKACANNLLAHGVWELLDVLLKLPKASDLRLTTSQGSRPSTQTSSISTLRSARFLGGPSMYNRREPYLMRMLGITPSRQSIVTR